MERIEAADALAAAQLTARLEAAWSEGLVGLQALTGPQSPRPTEAGEFSPRGAGA